MKKPCDNCVTNMEQALLYDEVVCFKTCERWKEWKQWKEIMTGMYENQDLVRLWR